MPFKQRLHILVAYYGILQLLHILALIGAAIEFARTGHIGFPAPPPPGGWDAQAEYFLIATALVDAVNVILALLFAYGFFQKASWNIRLGYVTLTITVYSAIIFAIGTLASGAWQHNLAAYNGLALLFVPALFLAGLWVSYLFQPDKQA